MKNKHFILKGIFTVIGILLLIFDSQTSLNAAQEAVTLCLYTVLPSLFPFVFLSLILNDVLLGNQIAFLRPLCKLCGIPTGAESLLVLGLIGGYPVGAQAAAEACRNGSITFSTYKRLLGFCNNAGPSFIFGLIAAQFTSGVIGWVIWGIHMLSALIVGMILPKSSDYICKIKSTGSITLSDALNSAIKIMGKICAWVILFRILTAFVLHYLPCEINKTIFGIFELTNGCVNLRSIPSEGLRFIAAICLLNFGGLCVAMQTMSVCAGLGTGLYFPGKVLQTVIGLIIGVVMLPLLFSQNLTVGNTVLTIGAAFLLIFVIVCAKKWWQFRQQSYIMK